MKYRVVTIDYADDGTPTVEHHDVDGSFEDARMDAEQLKDKHAVVSIYLSAGGERALLWSTRADQGDPLLLAELWSRIGWDPIPGLELDGEPTTGWEPTKAGQTPTLTWGRAPCTIQLALGPADQVLVRVMDGDRVRIGWFDANDRKLSWSRELSGDPDS